MINPIVDHATLDELGNVRTDQRLARAVAAR
jgi:hypothetical protein